MHFLISFTFNFRNYFYWSWSFIIQSRLVLRVNQLPSWMKYQLMLRIFTNDFLFLTDENIFLKIAYLSGCLFLGLTFLDDWEVSLSWLRFFLIWFIFCFIIRIVQWTILEKKLHYQERIGMKLLPVIAMQIKL